jgi:drug/metabolite transporter (DMT)-like permease
MTPPACLAPSARRGLRARGRRELGSELATIPLFSLLFLRLGGVERVRVRQWVGVGLAIAGVALVVLAKREGPRLAMVDHHAGGWTIWLYSVVFPVYLGYTWWTAAIAARGVATIAPYVLLVPLVGGAIAVAWVGEPLAMWLAAGAALILLGLALGRDWIPRLASPRR